MSSLANLRLISKTATSVTLGVTTDSFAGDLYLGMRTSGPYATTGDETTIIADAVGTIQNPAYGEQTFTVDGLPAGTQYYFGAVQQYGDPRAERDHTFEASRPLPPGVYTCSVERDVLVDGTIKHFAVDEPIYTLGGMYFPGGFTQDIADTENFVTNWTHVGSAALSNSPIAPPMAGKTAKRWDDDGSAATGEMSMTLAVAITAPWEWSCLLSFSIYIYSHGDYDNDYIRVEATEASVSGYQVFDLKNGVPVPGGTSQPVYQNVRRLGNGWSRIEFSGEDTATTGTAPWNYTIKISRVDAPDGTTTLKDGSKRHSIFGANASGHITTRVPPLDYCDGVKTIPMTRLDWANAYTPRSGELSFYVEYTKESPGLGTATGHQTGWQFYFYGNAGSDGGPAIWAQGASFPRTYVYLNDGANPDIINDTVHDWGKGEVFAVRGRVNASGEFKSWVSSYAPVTGGALAAPFTEPLHGFSFCGRQGSRTNPQDGKLKRVVFWPQVLTDQELEGLWTNTLTLKGDFGYTPISYSENSLTGRTVDAHGAVFRSQNSTTDRPSFATWCSAPGPNQINQLPVLVLDSDNCTWNGGVWLSEIPIYSTYVPTYCNSKNFEFRGSGVINDQRHMGGWDPIEAAGLATGWVINDCYMTFVRDDCIESDSGTGGTVSDTLIDGTFNGHSSTNDTNPDYVSSDFIHDAVLMRMKPFLTGNQPPTPQANQYYDALLPWKLGAPPNVPSSIKMVNCVYAMQVGYTEGEANGNNFWNSLWNDFQTVDSANNKILWMSVETPIAALLSPDPAWTVLTGNAAVDEWYSVRDAWLAAHTGSWDQHRINWFAQHGVPPNGEVIELGFTNGPTSGTFNLADYGRDLDTWGLSRGCSFGIKLTPSSTNLNGTILTLGHMTLSVAGDIWTFSAEGGRTVSVTQAYSAGVQIYVKAKTSPWGWIVLRVGSNQVDNPLWDDEADFYTPVASGAFGSIPVDYFRLSPFYLKDWELAKWDTDA